MTSAVSNIEHVDTPAYTPRSQFAYAASLAGVRVKDSKSLVSLVARGLPYKALVRLAGEVNRSESRIGSIIGVSTRTLARRKESGRLDPDESDRLLRIARLLSLAFDLFEGDRESAISWFERPQRGLGGATPMQFARTDAGAGEVERLIGRLEHGVGA